MKNSSGQFSALPITTSASGLIVNQTVLKKARVDPASLTIWGAFDAAAAEVEAKGLVPFELAGSKDGSAGNVIDWLAPGAFTDSEFASFEKGQFQNAAYRKLLGILDPWKADGWTNVGYTSVTGDDMTKALAEDKAAFALTANATINTAWQFNPKAHFTYQPIPSISGGKPYLIGGEGIAFGAAKSGSHLAEAKKYLAFLAQPDVTAALAKSVGNPPGLSDPKRDLGRSSGGRSSHDLSGGARGEAAAQLGLNRLPTVVQ